MYIGCEKFMFGLWMWKIFHAWSEYISELLSELKAVEQDTKPTILVIHSDLLPGALQCLFNSPPR